MNQASIKENLQEYWPQLLWGFLTLALVGNVTYLLWPHSPETIVIRPHPATLRTYQPPEEMPVLVEAPSRNDDGAYLLVNVDKSSSKGKAGYHIKRISGKSPATKDKKHLTGKINLNKASVEQLQLLPGIGPKMAERILEYRKQHGAFQRLEQLLDVSGIGPKKFENLVVHCAL